ncbi:MAG TPA: FMN-binding protein [Thermoanaerobaculia bacterium]|nr:FMN-binding protein [Thermoanaerobaculia bacterium]
MAISSRTLDRGIRCANGGRESRNESPCRGSGRARPSILVVLLAMLLAAAPAAAKVFLTQEEALKLAFPGATVERRTAFLTEAEQKEVVRMSGGPPPSALAVAYLATKDGHPAGTAYFDTHVVRTQPETVMIAISPAGTIARIEVLSFSEPEEYMPREHWYAQFPGKGLDDELSVKRGIRPVSGATLTARATTEAARRVLALHQVLARRVKKAA